MKATFRFSLLFIACLAIPIQIFAQEEPEPSADRTVLTTRVPNPLLQPGINFNFTGSGARALGLGQAFIGVADDATALSWNPAGLTQLLKPEISFVYNSADGTSKLEDIRRQEPISNNVGPLSNIEYASFTLPIKIAERSVVFSAAYQSQLEFKNEGLQSQFDYIVDTTNFDFADNPATDQLLGVVNEQFVNQFDEENFEGYLRNFSIGSGVQLNDMFSFGLAGNYWFSEFNYTESTNEIYTNYAWGYFPLNEDDEPLSAVQDVRQSNWFNNPILRGNYTQSYSGSSNISNAFSFNFGMLIDFSRAEKNPIPIKLGFSYKTPFRMNYVFDGAFVSADNYSYVDLEFDENEPNLNGESGDFVATVSNSGESIERYGYESRVDFSFPSSVGVGLAWTLKNLTLSADYEIRSFSQSSTTERFVPVEISTYSYNDSSTDLETGEIETDSGTFFYEPEATANTVETTNGQDLQQIRIGAEYLLPVGFGVIPLRVGFQSFPTTINNENMFATYNQAQLDDEVYEYAGGRERGYDPGVTQPMSIESLNRFSQQTTVTGRAFSLGTGFITGRFAIDVAYQFIGYERSVRYFGFEANLPNGEREGIRIGRDEEIEQSTFDAKRLTASVIVYF